MNQTFEEFLLEYTGRDVDYHISAGTTGIDFARNCWYKASKMNKQDIEDIKTILKEQSDSLERLSKIPLPHPFEYYKIMQTIYKDILECNKIMTEIINGPSGGIVKIIERTK